MRSSHWYTWPLGFRRARSGAQCFYVLLVQSSSSQRRSNRFNDSSGNVIKPTGKMPPCKPYVGDQIY